MICSTSFCLFDTIIDPWNECVCVCVCVCVYVCVCVCVNIYVFIYVCVCTWFVPKVSVLNFLCTNWQHSTSLMYKVVQI